MKKWAEINTKFRLLITSGVQEEACERVGTHRGLSRGSSLNVSSLETGGKYIGFHFTIVHYTVLYVLTYLLVAIS